MNVECRIHFPIAEEKENNTDKEKINNRNRQALEMFHNVDYLSIF